MYRKAPTSREYLDILWLSDNKTVTFEYFLIVHEISWKYLLIYFDYDSRYMMYLSLSSIYISIEIYRHTLW